MLAVRANERAAAAAGVSVKQTKIVAFAVSAFVAGIAGALSGYRFGSVTPDYFGIFQSLSFLAFAYMGGISSVTGAVVGGVLVTNGIMFTVLQKWIGVSPTYSILIGGLGLILTVVANPEGIAGTWRQLAVRWRAREERAAGGAGLAVAAAGSHAPPPTSVSGTDRELSSPVSEDRR
jgi:branched-chain amino acid transport system permease protein